MTDPLVHSLHVSLTEVARRLANLENNLTGDGRGVEPVSVPPLPRRSVAPAPDYTLREAIDGPPDPEPCGCEEAEALRHKLAATERELSTLRRAVAGALFEIGERAA